MKFKVGEIVKIKDNFYELKYEDTDYGGKDPRVTNPMMKFAGTVHEITSSNKKEPYSWCHLRDTDGWTWDERWLEPVEKIVIEEDLVLGVFT